MGKKERSTTKTGQMDKVKGLLDILRLDRIPNALVKDLGRWKIYYGVLVILK